MTKGRQKTHIRFGFSRSHSKQHVSTESPIAKSYLVTLIWYHGCASKAAPVTRSLPPPSVTHLSGSPQPIGCWKVRWGPSLLLTHNFVQLALRQGPNIMATSSWHQYRRLDLFVIWLFTKLYRFVQLCHSLTTLSNALYDIPADKFRISWRHPRGNNTGALSVIHQINSKISSLWWHACFHLVLFLCATHFSILRRQVHT